MGSSSAFFSYSRLYSRHHSLPESSTMISYQSNEDNLVTFLSGFNQLFLGYLLFNIMMSTGLGVGVQNIRVDGVDADYGFEIKTAMERMKNHSTFVAALIFLTVAAVVFVSVSRAMQHYRRLHISDLDIYIIRRQES